MEERALLPALLVVYRDKERTPLPIGFKWTAAGFLDGRFGVSGTPPKGKPLISPEEMREQVDAESELLGCLEHTWVP